MKKLLLLLILAASLLISCQVKNGSAISEGSEGLVAEEVEYRGLVSNYWLDINDTVGTYTGFVLDEITAVQIGDAILKKVFTEKYLADTILSVCETRQDNGYFIINRRLKGDIVGGDVSVALSKQDGRIVKIWMGE